jgi:hypothetical protein
MEPFESAEKIVEVIKGLDKTGVYLDFENKPIPW